MPPVVHKRRVDFDANSLIMKVCDNIIADDSLLRDVTFLWHVPKDKSITLKDGSVFINSETRNSMIINFDGDTPDDISIVTGKHRDKVFSCVSYRANQLEPSQLLRIQFKQRHYLNVISHFSLTLV